MMYYRIYTPASEQGFYTAMELFDKYGRRWEKIIEKFRVERIDSDKWWKQFAIGN